MQKRNKAITEESKRTLEDIGGAINGLILIIPILIKVVQKDPVKVVNVQAVVINAEEGIEDEK